MSWFSRSKRSISSPAKRVLARLQRQHDCVRIAGLAAAVDLPDQAPERLTGANHQRPSQMILQYQIRRDAEPFVDRGRQIDGVHGI